MGPTGPNPEPEARDLALELVNAALIAKLAGTHGAPRLAVRAARRAGELVGELTIALSPLLARVTPESEADALDGVRCSGDLVALVRPQADDDLDERAGPT